MKRAREIGFSTSLYSEPHIKVALPTIAVQSDGIRSMAIQDTGCSQSLISRLLCHSWKKKEVDMFTVGERSLKYSGIGLIKFDVSNMSYWYCNSSCG